MPPSDRPEAVLSHAVEEAARLLQADGAILYMLEPDGETLRWACDAGITSDEERAWMRSLVLPVGTGMYGKAVAERAVRITHDYEGDQSFPHAWMTDQVVRGAKIRSMCVAPLLSGAEVLGALGVYSSLRQAFGEAQRMRERKNAPQPAEPLTEREREVLSLVGHGASNKDIAAELFITERTARTHVSNILGKLGLSSRTQAALYAVENKLVQPRGS